jgi:hypothetical protein
MERRNGTTYGNTGPKTVPILVTAHAKVEGWRSSGSRCPLVISGMAHLAVSHIGRIADGIHLLRPAAGEGSEVTASRHVVGVVDPVNIFGQVGTRFLLRLDTRAVVKE